MNLSTLIFFIASLTILINCLCTFVRIRYHKKSGILYVTKDEVDGDVYLQLEISSINDIVGKREVTLKVVSRK